MSTRENRTASIWILDLDTRRLSTLTGQPQLQGDPTRPIGFFRPSWSPDGRWLAFSSDRNGEWKGHSSGVGWEHVQELSVYTSHNIHMQGMQDHLDYLRSRSAFETTVEDQRTTGLSLTCRTSE